MQIGDLLYKILPTPRREAEFDHRFDADLPQQSNSYDCGIYVIEFARCVLQAFVFVAPTLCSLPASCAPVSDFQGQIPHPVT